MLTKLFTSYFNFAESEGFEPSELYRPDALAVRWFKPLTQLSITPRLKTKSNKTKQISNESTVYEGLRGGSGTPTHTSFLHDY